MGKIRVKTIGLEDQEQAEKEKIKARNEAKKLQAQKDKGEDAVVTEPEKKEPMKIKATASQTTKKHSSKYSETAELVDKNKKYSLNEALELLPKLQRAKFDETVELHINAADKGISGSLTLPHGTGKKARIEILNFSDDAKHVEAVIKSVESGQIDFDILIATPDTMPKLAKVARVLGPRGLMPNPKNGTVSPKPQEVAKQFEGGQVNFKTESKFPLIHLAVGKISFGDKKLSDNIKAVVKEIKTKNIRKITLKSTMSQGIKLDTASL